MIEYFIIFKGTNKDFAIFEFKNLWKIYYDEDIKLKVIQNIGYKFQSNVEIEKNSRVVQRITLSNYLGKIINKSDTIENLVETDFNIKEKDTFKFKIKKLRSKYKHNLDEREIAEKLYNKLGKPKVSIQNPTYELNIVPIEEENKFILCEKIFENEKEYLRRMPKERPIKKPYRLKSDMARTCINSLNIKDGLILDPFCGIGGILLEAYDMGFDVIGNDISWNDLRDFKINFDYYYKEHNAMRTLADSTTRFLKDNTIDGIVTDIPYGKSSRVYGNELYEKFLQNSRKFLKKGHRIVIVYANFIDFRDLANKYFDEVVQIDQYINKSMTRHILVLENNK